MAVSTGGSQKTSGVEGRKDGSGWSGRLRKDSAIVPLQLRSGRTRSRVSGNYTSSTKPSKKVLCLLLLGL